LANNYFFTQKTYIMKKITLNGLSGINGDVVLNREQLKNTLGGATAFGTDDPTTCPQYVCECFGGTAVWEGEYCTDSDKTNAILNYCSSGGACIPKS
jgi:hypothetical protein